jgi:hypothetical protein
MYVLYYALMLQCWHLIWIVVRTNHPCLGVGCHTHRLQTGGCGISTPAPPRTAHFNPPLVIVDGGGRDWPWGWAQPPRRPMRWPGARLDLLGDLGCGSHSSVPSATTTMGGLTRQPGQQWWLDDDKVGSTSSHG